MCFFFFHRKQLLATLPFLKFWCAGCAEFQLPPRPRASGTFCFPPAGGGQPEPSACPEHLCDGPVFSRATPSPPATPKTPLSFAVCAGGPLTLPVHLAAKCLQGLDTSEPPMPQWRGRGGAVSAACPQFLS